MQPAPLTGPRRVSALAPCVELQPSAVVPPQPTVRPLADRRTAGANASGETSRYGDTHEPEPVPQSTIRLPAPFAGAIPGFGNGGIVARTLARSLDPLPGASVEVRLERPVPLVTELTVTLDAGSARLEQAGTTLATAAGVEEPPATPPHVTADEAVETTPVVPLPAHPAPGCFAAGRPALLGTARAHQLAPVPVDAPVVVTGWRTGGTDRKTHAGSALCTTAGEPLAVAASTWIHPKEYRP
jgi:hypothetical protein